MCKTLQKARMAELNPYSKQVWAMVISKIFKSMGFQTISSVGLEVLMDVAHNYLKDLTVMLHDCSEVCGRTSPNLEDILLMSRKMNIKISDLDEYVNYIAPNPLKIKIPEYPLKCPSRMNFLKPGSQEVVTRPVYIHEHLPPMYPEVSDDDNNSDVPIINKNSLTDLPSLTDNIGDTSSQPSNKRCNDTGQERPSGLKRIKLDNENSSDKITSAPPVRELQCVTMTNSGFLSPAREGKLPSSRIPSCLLNTFVPREPRPLIHKNPSLPVEQKLPSVDLPELKNEFKPKKGIRKVKELKVLPPVQDHRLEGTAKLGRNKKIKVLHPKNKIPKPKKNKILKPNKVNEVVKPKQKPLKICDPSELSLTTKYYPEINNVKPDKLKSAALLDIFKPPDKEQKVRKGRKELKELKGHTEFNKYEENFPYEEQGHQYREYKNYQEYDEQNKYGNYEERNDYRNDQELNDYRKYEEPNEYKNYCEWDDYRNYEDQQDHRHHKSANKYDEAFKDIFEPEPEKLTTQPDQQKLSIFKRISKPKEDKSSSKNLFEKYEIYNNRNDRHMNESIETVVKGSPKDVSSMLHKKSKERKSSSKMASFEEIYEPPPTVVDHVKVKKHKKKHHKFPNETYVPSDFIEETYESSFDNRNLHAQQKESDSYSFIKNDESTFSYFPHLSSAPDLIPSSISQHPLIPKYSEFQNLEQFGQSSNFQISPPLSTKTYMMPPMQNIGELFEPQTIEIETEEVTVVRKDHKKLKKDKKDKEKRKKEKLKQLKYKEKEEKRKEKEQKKLDKETERKKQRDKEFNNFGNESYRDQGHHSSFEERRHEKTMESVVPKLKLKLESSSPQASPTRSPKITIKPIVKQRFESSSSQSVFSQPNDFELFSSPEIPKQKSKKHKSSGHSEYSEPVPPSSSKFIEPITININNSTKEKSTKIKNKQKRKSETVATRPEPFYFDEAGNQIWICPGCGAQDDGSPMIGCDGCDAWYHWVCVGITCAPPDSKRWFCIYCKKR